MGHKLDLDHTRVHACHNFHLPAGTLSLMSALWRVHLHHFLHNRQESNPAHKNSKMTAPPTPEPTPQTMGLGPLNAAFDGVGRTRWLVRSIINRMSGLEMLAVVIDVNVLSANCVVGLIRCVDAASS